MIYVCPKRGILLGAYVPNISHGQEQGPGLCIPDIISLKGVLTMAQILVLEPSEL